jgi:hypothetical protein
MLEFINNLFSEVYKKSIRLICWFKNKKDDVVKQSKSGKFLDTEVQLDYIKK